MAVEITGFTQTHKPGADSRKGAASRSSADTDTAAKSGHGTDTITLTDAAAGLSNAREQAAGLPVTDESRIAGIRQAIEDGSYKPNAERIADKMLKSDLELVG